MPGDKTAQKFSLRMDLPVDIGLYITDGPKDKNFMDAPLYRELFETFQSLNPAEPTQPPMDKFPDNKVIYRTSIEGLGFMLVSKVKSVPTFFGPIGKL
jgi:hypothetical protein